MSILSWVTDRARALTRRSSEETEMDEELAFHLEMETEKNLREGMAPEEARRRAVLAFGGVEKHRETLREGWRIPLLEDLLRDARYAVRSLRRTPGFTATVVLTLAVGIGATTAMYGVMSRLLLQPPPHVVEPDRVVKLFYTDHREGRDAAPGVGQDYRYYDALRERSTTLASIAGYVTGERAVGSGVGATRVIATMVTPGFWSTLGTRAALGRLFSDEEAAPVGGADVAVLGRGFWRRHYGEDPSIAGQTIEVNGRSYEVVGVAPRGFRGVGMAEVDLWLPISAYVGADAVPGWTDRVSGFWLHVVGRLTPGVSREGAGAELTILTGAHRDELHAALPPGVTATSTTGLTTVVSAGPVTGALGSDLRRIPEARISVWLMGIAVVLLGTACVNVACLLLLRAMRRRREMAVRIALGMGRGRMAAQLFTESLILAGLGGAVALAVALAGGAWIHRVLLPELAWESSGGLDWGMLALTAACVVATALVAGLAPLLQTRADPVAGLRDGVPQGATARSPLLRALLSTQIALSVVLLVGAGLFLRSLQRIDALDLGFDPDPVLVATLSSWEVPGQDAAARSAFWDRGLERVRAVPGVERAAMARIAPLRGSFGERRYRFSGDVDAIVQEQGLVTASYVTPDFFGATGIRLLQGRDLQPEERGRGTAIVVNEALARAGWPGRSPVGECVPWGEGASCATVVGVVENSRRSDLVEDSYLMYYEPLAPDQSAGSALLIRQAPGMRVTAEMLRAALRELDPALPYLHVETLGAELEPQIRPWRLGASVFTAFGLLAMLLAGIGLYSALAYGIAQRTREIGIRLAIGAESGEIVRMVTREAVRVAAVGIAFGLAVSLVAGRWIGALLFDVSPRDAVVLGSVAAALLVIALVASVIPARRAMRVSPVVAMRVE